MAPERQGPFRHFNRFGRDQTWPIRNVRAGRARAAQGEAMLSFIQKFWKDESGQDLIEYTLLMAFVALASASLFISAGQSISGIWGTTSNQLSSANSLAS
jgi:Flp pilus assembly pilin Flp